jgi:adenosylcobinamide-GDP ribazoletransferase
LRASQANRFPDLATMNEWLDDFKTAVAFLTRLPMPHPQGAMPPNFVRSHRMFPVVGALIGAATGLFCLALRATGLPDLASAALALGAGAILTGALHEDGLADTADGLGGGTRARKLKIMRDSRIGTYGVCALVISLALRWSTLAAIAAPRSILIALLLAHVAARAGLPLFMALVPPARSDGLSAGAGRPAGPNAAIALGLGALVLALGFGPGKAILAVIILAVIGLMTAWLAVKQIGGQTGDILGAFEQMAETAILLMAAALFHAGLPS